MCKIRLFWISFSLLLIFNAATLSAQEQHRFGEQSNALVQPDAPYKNPHLPIEERVEDLLGRMTLEEKIGQMTLIERNSVILEDITNYHLGGLLSGGGGYPTPNDPETWLAMVNEYQSYALQTRLGIPLLYGVDAVHGHSNLRGATIFPHNIGLGATRDPDLVERIGRITAIETAATGIYWNFSPVVAVPQDIRWGRTYEGFSENTDLVSLLAVAYLHGLQGDDLTDPTTILGTPKHYVGDGGAIWGTSFRYSIDQGMTGVDEATLRAVHLPPYIDAIDAGARTIMVSFSGWGGIRMHAQRYLITDVLKGELGFDGFVVSDWGGIDMVAPSYYDAVVIAINAGIDMNMAPYYYQRFIAALKRAVDRGDVPLERIDDAVRRILTVKFELGLFERPFADDTGLATVGSAEHRAVAREAVSKSLVLLKDEADTLPIPGDVSSIFVAGPVADNIGIQSGGWTIEWQGALGDITPGTTILEGIQHTAADGMTVYYDPAAAFADVTDAAGSPMIADVGIVVVGEFPYAEGFGDAADLLLHPLEALLVERTRARCERLVIILISGRPMIVTDQLELADAFVAAWLPGTEGQGVADALFGYQPFTGKLPYTWPRSMDQLPFDFDHLGAGEDGPLFPFGYGLETEATGLPLPAASPIEDTTK